MYMYNIDFQSLRYFMVHSATVTRTKIIYGFNIVTSYSRKESVLSTGWSKEDPYGEHHLYWSNPPEKVLDCTAA